MEKGQKRTNDLLNHVENSILRFTEEVQIPPCDFDKAKTEIRHNKTESQYKKEFIDNSIPHDKIDIKPKLSQYNFYGSFPKYIENCEGDLNIFKPKPKPSNTFMRQSSNESDVKEDVSPMSNAMPSLKARNNSFKSNGCFKKYMPTPSRTDSGSYSNTGKDSNGSSNDNNKILILQHEKSEESKVNSSLPKQNPQVYHPQIDKKKNLSEDSK